MKYSEVRIEVENLTIEQVVRGLDTVNVTLKGGSTITVWTDKREKLRAKLVSVRDETYLFECVWLYGINETPGSTYEVAIARSQPEPELTLVGDAVNGR